MIGAERHLGHLRDGDVVPPHAAANVLAEQGVIAQVACRVLRGLEQFQFEHKRVGLRRIRGQLEAQLLPDPIIGLGGVQVRVPNAAVDRTAVEVHKVRRDAGAGIGKRGRLAIPFDAIVGIALNLDQAGGVAVDQPPAVEVIAEAVPAAVLAIGGELAVDIMREARAVHLRPVHRKVFLVAERPLLKIKRFEHPAYLHRAAQRWHGQKQTEDERESFHGPITVYRHQAPRDLQ